MKVFKLISISLLIASQAYALSMTPYSLQELWSEANRIGLGRVTAIKSRWRGTRIITTFELTLTQKALKGPLTDRLTFQMLGGEIDGIRQVIPGSPEIHQEDELFVFLRCRSEEDEETCSPVGLGQGIWRTSIIAGGPDVKWVPLTDQVKWPQGSAPLAPKTLKQLAQPPSRSTKVLN